MSRPSAEALAGLVRWPASERNKAPILEVLQRLWTSGPAIENVLEIGSASGQHVAHFAPSFPSTTFQPTDMNSSLFGNINTYRRLLNLTNVLPPVVLDLTWPLDDWPVPAESYDIIYCANVLHISPWTCTEGLFRGASRVLRPAGRLVLYGPFAVDGALTPESNRAFDASLRSQNSLWGIRDTGELKKLATCLHLRLVETVDMPANNKILLFSKTGSQPK